MAIYNQKRSIKYLKKNRRIVKINKKEVLNMRKVRIKILITSVGSLVGHNILDVLESPLFCRRNLVKIIGSNSIVNSPNNFRCDKCYKVPNTSTDEFSSRMIEIIRREEPDLILSARDEDTEALMVLMNNNQQLKGRLPYGELKTLTYALNKWQTWLFTQKYDLPFANTFVMGKSGGINELKSFVKEVGYPMIAKPIQGFASKGVFFVRNWNQVEKVSTLKNYMFQEYLGKPDAMDNYFELMDEFSPLFASAPGIYHHSCHTFISPKGDIDKIFISKNDHKNGATVGFRRVKNDKLEALAISYAKAIYNEGGYGPLTVQFRLDKNDNWKAQEMNFRTNGNTYPRFMMGQDDLGLIINGILPDLNFPIYYAPEEASDYIIEKSLLPNIMSIENLEELNNNGVWKR